MTYKHPTEFRRWYQFGIADLLIGTAFCAMSAAFVALVPVSRIDYARFFIYPIVAVAFVVIATVPIDALIKRTPTIIGALLLSLTYLVGMITFRISAAVIDHRPTFTKANLYEMICDRGSQVVIELVMPLLALVAADFILFHRGLRENRMVSYLPRLAGVAKALSFPRGRLLLVIWLVIFLGNATVNGLTDLHGTVYWSYDPAFFSCVAGWCALWIADSSCRPGCPTLRVAIIFLLYSLFVIPACNAILE